MPLSTNNQLILAKSEATYGTSSSPANTDAVLVTGDIDVTPLEIELVDRELKRGFVGNSPQVVAQRLGRIAFSVEMSTSGTAGTAPRWGTLHKACGFAETIVASTSVTYSLVSSGFSSATLAFHNDGMAHVFAGCRGTVAMEGTVGERGLFNYEFMGLYASPTDTAKPAGNFTLQAPPLVVNSENTPTISIHGFNACLSQFSFDVANEMFFRQDAGCVQQVQITGRAPTGQITIEHPTIAQKDFYASVTAQTAGAIQIVHGTQAGRIMTINEPTASFGQPSLTDNNGIQYLQLPVMPLPSSGNDEMTLVLT